MATNAYDTEPQQLRGAIPYIFYDESAAKAADFYIAAFGAREISRQPADDGKRLMHCHLDINGGPVMLSDSFPEHGHPAQAPAGFMVHLQVEDCDALFDKAIAAGAVAVMPPADMFWGDRYGQLRDPFGVRWAIGSAKK